MTERSISWHCEHGGDNFDYLVTRREEEAEKNEDEESAMRTTQAADAADAKESYWSENAWGMRLSCPITHQLFTDPVMASDGFMYERGPIERWYVARGTSPLTRARIDGVFHAVPSARNEVAAFLASMDITARRRWRCWARTAEFQATIDALERDLVPKITAVPMEWRRLMHVAPDDWACWIDEARLCASVTVDSRHRDQETPEGTAAAKIGRRHGWTEEAMANVWHQLSTLASGVEFVEPPLPQHEDVAHISTCFLVYRAVVRLLAYMDVTCVGYIMAGPVVARCAETQAWAAATAIVRSAPEINTNILVRTLSASFADSTPGWRLIAEVCRRELGASSHPPSYSPSSTPATSSKRRRSEEDEYSDEDDYASELEEMEGELLDTGDGFMIEVTRRDSDADESGEDGEEEEGEGDGEEEDGDGGGVQLPATFGHVVQRSRAEELAFEAAMATVDSRADGLFSYDDNDDRRRRRQYQRQR